MLTADDREEIRQLIAEALAGFRPPSSVASSDTVFDVAARAIEVFGNREKARRWLDAPLRVLGDKTPISALDSRDGVGRVLDLLGQIEHGVW